MWSQFFLPANESEGMPNDNDDDINYNITVELADAEFPDDYSPGNRADLDVDELELAREERLSTYRGAMMGISLLFLGLLAPGILLDRIGVINSKEDPLFSISSLIVLLGICIGAPIGCCVGDILGRGCFALENYIVDDRPEPSFDRDTLLAKQAQQQQVLSDGETDEQNEPESVLQLDM